MKPRRPQGPDRGPYRGSFNEEDAILEEQKIKDAETLKKIKKDISSEDVISLELPEEMKDGYVLEGFTKLIRYGFKPEKYKEIVLYSASLGVLKFTGSSEHPFSKSKTLLHWQNEEKTSDITVCFDKIKQEVTLFSLSENPPTKNAGHEKTDKTPKIEPINPNAEALENMLKEIEKWQYIGIQLPENIKPGDEVKLFENALAISAKPTDAARNIVFYSVNTGILKYTGYEGNPSKKALFRYRNDSESVLLAIQLDKKVSSAKVFQLTKLDKPNTIK